MNTPKSSAPPFPVANSAGRPRRKYNLYSAPSQNPLQKTGSVEDLGDS